MTRAPRPPHISPRGGLDASAVALPGAGPWASVLDFLAWRLPALDRAGWAARMAAGEVLDESGQALAPDTPFLRNTRIWYYRHVDAEPPLHDSETLLFQDDWLVVADKPHFLPVTPKGRYLQETLLVRLKRKLGIDTLVPMHRLDRETAGLVVFTIQPATRHAYQSLLRDRQVHKVYEAIAPWRPELAGPLWRRSRLEEGPRFMAMHEVGGEPNAHTLIEQTERLGHWARYKLTPETGQKHQLRAHMHALGAPIFGDRIYPTLLPPEPADAPQDFSRPLRLLAREIAFTDPVTGQVRSFTSTRTLDWPDAQP